MNGNLHQAGVRFLRQLGRHAEAIMDAYLAGSVGDDALEPGVQERLVKDGVLYRPEPGADLHLRRVVRALLEEGLRDDRNRQIDANTALLAEGADAVAGHLNGMELLTTEVNGSFIVPAVVDLQKKVQFTLYKDGTPVFTKAVTSSTPFRLPAGYRSEVFQVGVNSSVRTFSVTIAESTAELAQASV